MEHKNYGLQLEPIVIGKDYVLGSYGSLDGTRYQPDGQWDDYLPQDEVQNLFGVEPYACVTFSTLNCIEILIRRQFGEERNYSDRFLATISGTAATKGNSLQTVAETLRKQGDVTEDKWPFDYLIDTFDKFYAPVSAALKELALAFIAEFLYEHEYVPCNPTALKQALTYSPLNIATYAWALDEATGLYYKPASYPDNHSPVVYGYVDGQYWKIFDSYDNTHKRMRWDTQFAQAKRHKLTRGVVVESFWKQFLRWLGIAAAALPTTPVKQPETPLPAPQPTVPTVPPAPATPYDWGNHDTARHSVRLICDEEGLPLTRNIVVNGKSYMLKDILCGCLEQESHFDNKAVNHNKDAQGNITSSDWGICQINDYWHIGAGKDFPSVAYVLDHPDAAVRFTARMFKAGKANLWSSYTSGAYKQWL